MEKKVMLGHRLRRLRREQGLNQSQLAEQLEISPSYLNLIEHNQRPVSAVLLLKLARIFDLDLQSFAEDDESRVLAGLREVFADPAVAPSESVSAQDLRELAALAPPVTQAIIELYRAFRAARQEIETVAERPTGQDGGAAPADAFPLDRVHDFFEAQGNHFPDLESAAEALEQEARLDPGDVYRGLADYLRREHGLQVRVMPQEVMGRLVRRFDRHGRRVLLSELLPRPSRAFHLACQIALLRQRTLLERLVAEAKLPGEAAQRLLRIGLANYFAGAVMMPYQPFLAAAQSLGYDIEILMRRFDASFEQICHRLTTLRRPGARGVPFSLLRIDKAGNVSKRFSSGISFARFGNICPRLNVFDAFRFPGAIQVERAQMPDGSAYICLSRDVLRPGGGHRQPPQRLAILLACDAAHARELVYAEGIDLAEGAAAIPVGPTCRLCPRLDCAHRAFPPIGRRPAVDETMRAASPFGMFPHTD